MNAALTVIGGIVVIFAAACLYRRAKGDRSPLVEEGYEDENGYHTGRQA